MTQLVSTVLAVIGAFFILVAGIGLVRMPDLFLRMSATAKASTLGVIFTFGAAIVYFQDLAVTSRCLAAIIFLLVTSPVAAHMIGRAGYLTGAELWKGTVTDQMREDYGRDEPPGEATPRAEPEPPANADPEG